MGNLSACGFTQIPAAECLKCHKRLRLTRESRPEGGNETPRRLPPGLPRATSICWGRALLVVSGVVLGAPILVAGGGCPGDSSTRSHGPSISERRWQAGRPPRLAGTAPASTARVFVETDRAGKSGGRRHRPIPDARRGRRVLTVRRPARVREAPAALAAYPRATLSPISFRLQPGPPAAIASARGGGSSRNTEDQLPTGREVEPTTSAAGLNAADFLSTRLSPRTPAARPDVLSQVITRDRQRAAGFGNSCGIYRGATSRSRVPRRSRSPEGRPSGWCCAGASRLLTRGYAKHVPSALRVLSSSEKRGAGVLQELRERICAVVGS